MNAQIMSVVSLSLWMHCVNLMLSGTRFIVRNTVLSKARQRAANRKNNSLFIKFAHRFYYSWPKDEWFAEVHAVLSYLPITERYGSLCST
jgi:hypothetical protein